MGLTLRSSEPPEIPWEGENPDCGRPAAVENMLLSGLEAPASGFACVVMSGGGSSGGESAASRLSLDSDGTITGAAGSPSRELAPPPLGLARRPAIGRAPRSVSALLGRMDPLPPSFCGIARDGWRL